MSAVKLTWEFDEYGGHDALGAAYVIRVLHMTPVRVMCKVEVLDFLPPREAWEQFHQQEPMAREFARRLVAAWNATRQLSIEELEQ